MLKALGEQLKMLAADPRNHYSSTIRQMMGPREALRFGQPLRRMILALPTMIAQLHRWSDGSGLSLRAMRMQRFVLSYLYDPIQFMSAERSGLFRYLDDAYLISRIYELTLADLDGSGIKNRSDDRSLAKNVPLWIALARRLLPKETARIDALLDEVARGRGEGASRSLAASAKRKRAVA